MKLHRLYSEPEIFEPIAFHFGVNLILGETTERSAKTNGVGKSLCVEFLNFALLKRLADSRVRKIPADVLSRDNLICVDFTIGGREITIKRSIGSEQEPLIIIDGESREFRKLEDAAAYLTMLLYNEEDGARGPSYRSMMSILIRDERSEFKSIVSPFDTELRIPPDYGPHLFLFGIDITAYKEAGREYAMIREATTARSKLVSSIEAETGKNLPDAQAELNELDRQVELTEKELGALKQAGSFDLVREELGQLDAELSEVRSKAAAITREIRKLSMFQGDHYVDSDEVVEIYRQFEKGLGDLLKRELEEVMGFKRKIDEFQRDLVNSRAEELSARLLELRHTQKSLDERYSALLSILDKKGELKSLRQAIAIFERKSEERGILASRLNAVSRIEREKIAHQRNRQSQIMLLDQSVSEIRDVISSFEKTILDIHEYVAGNRKSSFSIKIGTKKEPVSIDMRIYDDGSHSNEREKVFIYDLALLINEYTSERHPGILIHDNIFDVDRDTLVKSLNFLEDRAEAIADKQYILTLNSDELPQNDSATLKLDVDSVKVAAFTKQKRFLRLHYQELD